MKSVNETTPIAVLGAGAWGTALALLLAQSGQPTRLWSFDQKHVHEMYHARVNHRYLPGHPFPDALTVYDDLGVVLEGIRDILIVVPSFGFEELLNRIQPYINQDARIAWGTKGFSQHGFLLHEVLFKILKADHPIAVLSGPSLAAEVAAGLPAAITLAGSDEQFTQDLIARFSVQHFHIQPTFDLIGVQLCGAIKNVFAIVTGMSDGLKLGSNARSVLMTHGLSEMRKLCLAMGGVTETVMGLAGLGDLILTCTDDQSRNRRFGLAVGAGLTKKEAEEKINRAIEGLYNVAQVMSLAKRFSVELPIAETVYRILQEELDPVILLNELLSRLDH